MATARATKTTTRAQAMAVNWEAPTTFGEHLEAVKRISIFVDNEERIRTDEADPTMLEQGTVNRMPPGTRFQTLT